MGLRDYQTKVRFAIDRCFEENQDVTINFSDINDYLLAGGYKVNKTTVYRYLDKLIKEGKIKKYLHEGGKQGDLRTGGIGTLHEQPSSYEVCKM